MPEDFDVKEKIEEVENKGVSFMKKYGVYVVVAIVAIGMIYGLSQ